MPDPGAGNGHAVRVGLLGYGYWGSILASVITRDRGAASIVAVAVAREASVPRVRAALPSAAVTTDAGHVLGDPGVEAVVIATPAPTHAALARAALAAGKHVLVEKPMAATHEAAAELVTLARTGGVVLAVGHVFVHHPAVERLVGLAGGGELGAIEDASAAWLNTGPTPADGDVLWNLGTDPLSILVTLFGDDVARVAVRRLVPSAGPAEVVELTLVYGDGPPIAVQLSWRAEAKTRRLAVVGSAARAVFDESGTGPVLVRSPGGHGTGGVIGGQGTGGAAGGHDTGGAVGGATEVPVGTTQPLAAEISAFLAAVRGGQAPAGGGRHGAAVTRLLEAGARSLAAGGEAIDPRAIAAPELPAGAVQPPSTRP